MWLCRRSPCRDPIPSTEPRLRLQLGTHQPSLEVGDTGPNHPVGRSGARLQSQRVMLTGEPRPDGEQRADTASIALQVRQTRRPSPSVQGVKAGSAVPQVATRSTIAILVCLALAATAFLLKASSGFVPSRSSAPSASSSSEVPPVAPIASDSPALLPSSTDAPSRPPNASVFQLCGVNAELLTRFQVSMDDTNRQRYAKLAGGLGCVRDAYVGFADDNRIALYEPVADVVGNLSSRPLLFFAVNTQQVPPWALAPHVVTIRLGRLPLHIWFAKLVAVAVAPTQHGVIVEADSIITPHCDALFGIASRFCGPHPLLALHPQQQRPSVTIPMDQRSTPFLHAHTVWTHRARHFAERILRYCSKEDGTGFESRLPAIDCSSDEEAMTTALWNAGYSSFLCTYDPYFGAPELDAWAAGLPLPQGQQNQAFFIVHGAKSLDGLAGSLRQVMSASKSYPVWADGNYSRDANWCASNLDPSWMCEGA